MERCTRHVLRLNIFSLKLVLFNYAYIPFDQNFNFFFFVGRPKYVVDPSVKGNNNSYGGYNNGFGMSSLANPLGQQGGFNSSMQQPHNLNQPFGQQNSFNPLLEQPHALSQPLSQQSGFNPPNMHQHNQPLGQQSGFNPPNMHLHNQPLGQQSGYNPPTPHPHNFNQPLGQQNVFNEPLNQPPPPNIYNPAQINNLNQTKSFGQLPNLNQQPSFQPIQSTLNNFSQAVPPSPNFNQPSSVHNQRAPSGNIVY